MHIKRTIYGKLIDTLIFVWIIVIIYITSIFFLNINNDEIVKSTILVSIIFSILLSSFIIEKYTSKFPFKLIIKDKFFIIQRAFTKKKIKINDILDIEEINNMSSFTGLITYKILYKDGSVLINNKRFKQLDKLISEIKRINKY